MNEIIISERQYQNISDLVLSMKQRARMGRDVVMLMMAERLEVMLKTGEVFVDFTEENDEEEFRDSRKAEHTSS
jgi:hypothetical protein